MGDSVHVNEHLAVPHLATGPDGRREGDHVAAEARLRQRQKPHGLETVVTGRETLRSTNVRPSLVLLWGEADSGCRGWGRREIRPMACGSPGLTPSKKKHLSGWTHVMLSLGPPRLPILGSGFIL